MTGSEGLKLYAYYFIVLFHGPVVIFNKCVCISTLLCVINQVRLDPRGGLSFGLLARLVLKLGHRNLLIEDGDQSLQYTGDIHLHVHVCMYIHMIHSRCI